MFSVLSCPARMSRAGCRRAIGLAASTACRHGVRFSHQPLGMLMPIKSRLPPDTAFDPETIRLLTTAFEKAWQTLNGSGGVGPHKDAQRDRLARLVIAL